MTNNPSLTPPVETLSEEALAEIEARANAATPGPLEARLGSGNNVCTALASIATATFDEFVCDVLPDYACNPGIAPRWEANRNFIEHVFTDIPALCQSLRAAWARIAELTTHWCECGHAKDKHGFFNDHEECYECDQASPDLCCEWRPAPRPNETAALREQLAEAHTWIDRKNAAIETWQQQAKENAERLAQVEKERDDFLNRSHQTVLFDCGCMFRQDGLDAEPMLIAHCNGQAHQACEHRFQPQLSGFDKCDKCGITRLQP